MLCIALGSCPAFAQTKTTLVPVPPMKTRVVDLTNTLDASETAALRQEISELESSTQAQLAVLIVPTTGRETIEQFATRVFANWKLGRKDEDDGVLVLVALKDRRMRIEVGKGLEGSITDIQAAAIIDREMAPRFRNGDYAGGVQAAVRALSQLVGAPATLPDTLASDTASAPMPVDEEAVREPTSSGGGLTPEGKAFLGVMLWSIGVGAWHGLGAGPLVATRRRASRPASRGKRSGKRGRRLQRPEPWAEALQEIEPEAPRKPRDWRLVLGLVGAGPLGGAAMLLNPFMAWVLAIPALFLYGLGYLCGRVKEVAYVLGGIAAVIAALVCIAFIVGADAFWPGFLWALAIGGVGLPVTVIVFGIRNTWRDGSVLGFAVRWIVVLGVVVAAVVISEPGPFFDETWIPVAVASVLALLFMFVFPTFSSGSGGRRQLGQRLEQRLVEQFFEQQ
ncbi:TPM domain-containing protein [Variovorax sp. UC74_104]|uniref:TPM domain-containing protein n=1 Tax=Variovorax sp. UC74_104 TaxID=3374555 RepID=UPI0037571721